MRIANYLFLLLASLSINHFSFAQKQNDQWRFGTGGGISFSTTPPSFVPGAAISTPEGSASVSDRATGTLLFYTDGVTVWNSLNQVMPNGNGLLGGFPGLLSSTTAAVIIPRPGSNNIYYIVTIDEPGSTNGVRYSVVDMNLNSGLGDIVAGQKNIFLYQTSSEKLEVVPASDGQSYWLITRDESIGAFVSFRITSTGIQTTPVISVIGQTNLAGHMKINRQFNRLAMGDLALGAGTGTTIRLYDFNNATGVLSNELLWNYTFSVSLIYGVEFSPNGKMLYVSNLERVIQYDISQLTPATIQNSAYQVTSGGQPASLQSGPDNKIYLTNGAVNVINCPDKPGAACNYQQNAVANQTGGGGYGLPKWVYYPDDIPISDSNSLTFSDSCFGNPTRFNVIDTSKLISVNWTFGDPNSGANNTATGFQVSHVFSQVSSFDIRAILTTACGTDTLFINDLQIVNCNSPCTGTIETVSDSCLQNAIPFSVASSATITSIAWNFGDPASGTGNTSTTLTPTHNFSGPGSYTVQAIVNFDCGTDTLERMVNIIDCDTSFSGEINSSPDSCLQTNITFSLTNNQNITNYSWDFGDPVSGAANTSNSGTPSHTFSDTGTYTVSCIVVVNCGGPMLPCFYIDTIYKTITIVDCNIPCTGLISYSPDSCLESNITFAVNSNQTITGINWDFGDPNSGVNNTSNSPNPTHDFSSAGSFTVSAIVNFTCGTDTLVRILTITDCDSSSAECELYVPNAFTPNGDGLNDQFKALPNCPVERFECTIFNRWGETVYKSSNQTAAWNGEYKGKACPIGVYTYIITYKFPLLPVKKTQGTVTVLK